MQSSTNNPNKGFLSFCINFGHLTLLSLKNKKLNAEFILGYLKTTYPWQSQQNRES